MVQINIDWVSSFKIDLISVECLLLYKGLADHFQGSKDDQDIDPDLEGSYKLPDKKRKCMHG